VGARPHPRGWGTFARYLGHYARDEEVLTLEDCVAHLTSRPARRLGLADRGLVAEGYVADLVLFDPATVADTATYEDSRRTPTGIPYVLIGGEFVIDEGARTAALPGRALRRDSNRPGEATSPR
jgi:N-acyl-D-amino-acid deacylase